MYQFSLESYINLFERAIAIDKDGEFPTKDSRVKNIKMRFTSMLYENVVRSLLEKDKLIFSFQICTQILLLEEKGFITNEEIRFLMIGGTAIDVFLIFYKKLKKNLNN